MADALQYGSDVSPFLGSGLEYAQSRPYETGDSVRSIDWRTTARTGRFFVKQHESPKQTPTWLALDDSGSVDATGGAGHAGGPTKWQWAVLLAGAIGLAALRRTRPVGLLLASGSRRPASLSRADLHGWMHTVRHRGAAGRSSLGDVVRGHLVGLPSRVHLVVLSDLHDPRLAAALKTCAESHDVTVLRLQDPAERGRTGGGLYRVTEAEAGEAFYATGRTWWDAGGVVDDDDLTRSGIDRMTLPTDGAWVAGLRDSLRQRDRRSKRDRTHVEQLPPRGRGLSGEPRATGRRCRLPHRGAGSVVAQAWCRTGARARDQSRGNTRDKHFDQPDADHRRCSSDRPRTGAGDRPVPAPDGRDRGPCRRRAAVRGRRAGRRRVQVRSGDTGGRPATLGTGWRYDLR